MLQVHFESKLNPEIQELLLGREFACLKEMITTACKVEHLLRQKHDLMKASVGLRAASAGLRRLGLQRVPGHALPSSADPVLDVNEAAVVVDNEADNRPP